MTKLISLLVSLSLLTCQQWQIGKHTNPASGGGGGITRVHYFPTSTTSAINISGGVTTQALGFTSTAGNFIVVEFAQQGATGTVTSVTCSGSTMTLGATKVAAGAQVAVYLYYLANAPACSSVSINWSSANGNWTSINAAEYSGLLTTATITSTAVTNEQAYVNTTIWTTSSSYTATAGSLLISGVAANTNVAGTFSSSAPWNVTSSAGISGAQGPELALQDDLSVTAGSYTGTGTWSSGASYQYYESFIVGFK